MNFKPLALAGAYRILPDIHRDERGSFVRTWCRQEFEKHVGGVDFVQASLSSNTRAGTIRGLHYQSVPFGETKLVRCVKGCVFDVVVDLRPESPTFRQWHAEELSEINGVALLIPEGVAHGFQSLCDESSLLYQISPYYAPEAARGVRWDDPAFAIKWPLPVSVISERDRTWPDFARELAA